MRRPVSREEMERYRSRSLSAEELSAFESRLKEDGLETDVRAAAGRDMYETLRASAYEESVDEDTLLAYVKGEVDAQTASLISELRRLDKDLDDTLLIMEGAKRQVDASLAAAEPAPAEKQPQRWRLWWGSGLGVALAAVLVLVLVLGRPPKGPVETVPAYALVDAAAKTSLSVSPDGTVVAMNEGATQRVPLSPASLAAISRGTVDLLPQVRSELSDLAAPTRDKMHLSPAGCLVLPSEAYTLGWPGIKAKSVTCELRDARGRVLAMKVVTGGDRWNYSHSLSTGRYEWSARWTNKAGQAKVATRRFQVVDSKQAEAMAQGIEAATDPVAKAVLLARSGYSYQSVQIIDGLIRTSPQVKGLKALRDSISVILT